VQKEFLEAGKIAGTFGILGEVRILPWCDSPEFLRGFSCIYIDEKELKVVRARVHKGQVLTLLEGYNNPEDAMVLKNKTVSIRRSDANLPPDRVFVEDLVGLEVFDLRKDAVIGKLKSVDNLPAGDLYVIEGRNSEILVPAIKPFVKKVDLDAGRITIETIEGMGDEN